MYTYHCWKKFGTLATGCRRWGVKNAAKGAKKRRRKIAKIRLNGMCMTRIHTFIQVYIWRFDPSRPCTSFSTTETRFIHILSFLYIIDDIWIYSNIDISTIGLLSCISICISKKLSLSHFVRLFRFVRCIYGCFYLFCLDFTSLSSICPDLIPMQIER